MATRRHTGLIGWLLLIAGAVLIVIGTVRMVDPADATRRWMLDLTAVGGLLVVVGGALVLFRWLRRFAVIACVLGIVAIGLIWFFERQPLRS